MHPIWYLIKLRLDDEIKKRWDVNEVHPAKLRPKRVKGLSDFKYGNWFILVEYCSDRLSVSLIHAKPISHVGYGANPVSVGTLHYGDPDLFDKMVELVESLGTMFMEND